MLRRIKENFIFPSEIRQVFSNSDSVNKKEIDYDIRNGYLGALVCIVLVSILSFLTVEAFKVAISNGNFNKLTILFILIAIINVANSVSVNFLLGYFGPRIFQKHLNIFMEEFKVVFPDNINTQLREFYSLGSGYLYYIQEIYRVLATIIVTAISLFLLNKSGEEINLVAGLTIGVMLLLAYSGYFIYHKNALAIRDRFITNRNGTTKQIVGRVSGPTVINLVNEALLPSAAILLVYYNLSVWSFYVVLLAVLVDGIWGIIKSMQNLVLTNRYIKSINRYLADLNNNYIFNEKTYKEFVESTVKSYKEVKPKNNIGLDLFNYAPINDKKNLRMFTYHFDFGVYKLIGVNGIGKTTLLKSLGLTQDYLVEKPSGYAFLNGKPLFDVKASLSKHRKKVIYLSKKTKEPKLKTLNKYKKITSEDLITQAVQRILKRSKVSYSEGEAAIVHILNSLIDIPTNGILIIDELLARIHDGEVYKIRSILIELLYKVAKEKKLIVITVDHAIELQSAVEITLTEKTIQ